MAKTLHDRFITALEQRGCKIVPNARTGKYTVLTNAIRPDTNTFFYVGFGGALRVGEASTRSLPCKESFKTTLLIETA